MNKFIKLIETVSPSITTSKPVMDILTIIQDHLNDVQIEDPKAYQKVIGEIYVIVNGPYFDLACATKAIAAFQNADGTMGGKISLDMCNQMATTMGITFDKFNQYDWFYTVNMIYSDYCVVLGPTSNAYQELAKAFLTDPDAPVGKAYLYYQSMQTV